MKFEDSMRDYGNDKPDVRFDMKHFDVTDLCIEEDGGGVPFFQPIAEKFKNGTYRRDLPAEIVKAMVVPANAGLSRTEADKLEAIAKGMGAAGLARAKVAADGTWTQSPFAKTMSPALRDAINQRTGAKEGDLLLFQFGKASLVHTVLANLRVHLAKKLELIPEVGHGGHWKFLWVVDPPLFEYDDEHERWAAAHHAFTRPHDEHVGIIESDPGKVLCYRYDLVLNGFEIAGGSIRLHDPEVQARVFGAMGIAPQDAEEKFGFLLKALALWSSSPRRHRPGHGPAGNAAGGQRQHSRRDRVPQDPKGNGRHERRPFDGRRRSAGRAAHPNRSPGVTDHPRRLAVFLRAETGITIPSRSSSRKTGGSVGTIRGSGRVRGRGVFALLRRSRLTTQ